MSISPPITEIQLIQNKAIRVVKGQGYVQPWKFKVKVMAKVKPIGHIWGLGFNWYICFWFRGNTTILGREQIPYLTLKIQGQGHSENRPKSNQVIYRSGPLIMPKMKEIKKVVQ